MKKTIVAIVLMFCLCNANGQTKVQKTKNGNYIAVAAARVSTPGRLTGKAYTDSKGVNYPVWISANGKLYIVRISKKTGKEYKQYLQL